MKEHNMRTKEIEVTPEWATKKINEHEKMIADGVIRQRPVNKRKVSTYASDMKGGKWGLSHESIAFDENGVLLDGLKRLWAVRKADVPVVMRVTTGVPSKTNGVITMDIINTGQGRSLAHQMHIVHGISSPTQVAAIVRNIGLVYSSDSDLRLSVSQALDVMDLHEPAISMLFGITTHSRQRTGPILAPMAVYYMTHPEKAKAFAVSFLTKEELKKGSPVLALIKWMEKNPHVGGRDYIMARLRTVSHCIHEFHHEKELEIAQPKDEAMYWLGALNKKNADAMRKIIYPLRTT